MVVNYIMNFNGTQHCIHSMPFSALAETTQVRQNCSTLAADELIFPALEQMRERYAMCAKMTQTSAINNYSSTRLF